MSDAISAITTKDVIRFNKAHLDRARVNLVNAQKRGDDRAVKNILRKIEIYKFVIGMSNYYDNQGMEIQKQIQEAGNN